MKCIAIDDEPIALSIIAQYCERRGGIELETYSSPRLGMKRIETWQPDLVLLDIELNGMSGLELARRLPPTCCLIFTTAYAHYALDGFEANAVDFLHKPYFYERFDRALQRAEQWIRMHDLLRMSESSAHRLVLKSGYRKVMISVDTILYIESIDNYVKVHLMDGGSLLSRTPLHRVEGMLPHEEFIRIHRSFLVPRNRIARFSRTEVELTKAGTRLPVGKSYAERVLASLGQP